MTCRQTTTSPLSGTRIVRIEDDPHDPDRVIVTDRLKNRASMTTAAVLATCRFAHDVEIRIGWDG